jgi:hypothetical protein
VDSAKRAAIAKLLRALGIIPARYDNQVESLLRKSEELSETSRQLSEQSTTLKAQYKKLKADDGDKAA